MPGAPSPTSTALRSASDIAAAAGDFTAFDRVVATFIAEQRADVGRAAVPRCRRCDHLQRWHPAWPGPCTFTLCACPGPEPA